MMFGRWIGTSAGAWLGATSATVAMSVTAMAELETSRRIRLHWVRPGARPGRLSRRHRCDFNAVLPDPLSKPA
jgi:hypothetical protein